MKQLFASGFGRIAFIMAQIYAMVRLIPRNHPYLQAQNIGRFGIHHVIGEAANHLVISRKNIDQIIVFIALLMGIVILAAQFIILFLGLITPYAFAQVSLNALGASSYFETEFPSHDIAFMMMDYVFGVPNVFNSCVATSDLCPDEISDVVFPFPFHIAFHELLRFYSTGLLLVGVLIFLYFVVIIVGETATTGTPFGQRFQNVWVPIRLVVAIGLLMPINYGLNSAQYITLYAAKLGSSLATNSWITFLDGVANGSSGQAVFSSGGVNPTGERETLVALPNAPDISPVLNSMSIIHACTYSYWKTDNSFDRSGPTVRGRDQITFFPPPNYNFYIKAYLVKNSYPWFANQEPMKELFYNTTYRDALAFYNNSDIIIRFGIYNEEEYNKYKGGVFPTCGEMRIKVNKIDQDTTSLYGAEAMQEHYFNMIRDLWFGTTTDAAELIYLSHRHAELKLPNTNLACEIGCDFDQLPSCSGRAGNKPCEKEAPPSDTKQYLVHKYQSDLNEAILFAWQDYNSFGNEVTLDDDIILRGWGGAGIWYNRIAQMNGAFVSSVTELPAVNAYPDVMEKVVEKKKAEDSDFKFDERFTPNLSDGKTIQLDPASEVTIARVLSEYYQYWTQDGSNQTSQENTDSGNIFRDVMNAIFGTEGLFKMRGINAPIHPLAQLSALGKSLVDRAVINVSASTGLAFLGPLLGKQIGAAADLASSFLSTTAFVGLTAGFVLYYVLPFLPFVYFFFAVGNWVKSIFEAMVGVPLWALAHLRLDGEGLPGDAAKDGYFLIFEIFIRPVLIVFGLIAAITIFTMQVRILHIIWDVVLDNLAGGHADDVSGTLVIKRDVIDDFFFTIIYAIVVYMLATASFKLIDKIPDNILRWMGAGVSSFADINQQDVKEGLTKYAAIGGLTIGQQATSGVREFAKGSGGALAQITGNAPKGGGLPPGLKPGK